jgi:hypothetical protein
MPALAPDPYLVDLISYFSSPARDRSRPSWKRSSRRRRYPDAGAGFRQEYAALGRNGRVCSEDMIESRDGHFVGRLGLLPARFVTIYRAGMSAGCTGRPSTRSRLRSVDLERQLVELAGELQRHLLIPIVDRGIGVGADVKGLVLLEDKGNRAVHLLAGDDLAIDFEHADAAPGRCRSRC